MNCPDCDDPDCEGFQRRKLARGLLAFASIFLLAVLGLLTLAYFYVKALYG